MRKFLALLTLTAVPAFAMGWNDCCDLDCNFTLGVDAVYWKPCVKEFTWGATSETNTTTEVTTDKNIAISPDYEWGVRIFGTISDQCEENAVYASWTWLRPYDRQTTKALHPYDRFQGSSPRDVTASNARESFRYHNVKLYGMHSFCKQCDSNLYAYAGGRYVYVQDRRKAEAFNATNNYRDALDAKFSGGGIAVGVGGQVGVWCDFGLTFQAGVVGLVGSRKLDLQSIDASTTLAKTTAKFSDSRTICLPGVDARLGLTWETDCWCVTIDLEVGYQVEHYFNMLALPTPQVNPSASTASSDVGFAGPYFGITLGY